MGAEFFVDTGAWFPLADPKHPDHATLSAALRALIAKRRRAVTTNLVVAETHALMLRRAGRTAALAFVRAVQRPPNVIVRSSQDLEETAVQRWLERYADKDLSFTDAVSFEVMAERGIDDVLTLDRHFVAAGFTVVNP